MIFIFLMIFFSAAVSNAQVFTWKISSTNNSNIPIEVSGLTDVSAIAVGKDSNGMTVTGASEIINNVPVISGTPADSFVGSWGANSYGQLGNNIQISVFPVEISTLSRAASIAGGFWHSLALKTDSTVWAWGNNFVGQLGDGTQTQRNTPVQVTGVTDIKALAAGQYHSLALKSDSTVWAWGDNSYGQLGDGSGINRNTPVRVLNLVDVKSVDGGLYHSLALKTDGTVWAWGGNLLGQLGDGTTTNRNVPVQVSGLSEVSAIAAGGTFSLALKTDGTVWAWGWNYCGALGNGTNSDSSIPVQISTLSNIKALAAGLSHGLALKADNTVWAWGFNSSGQLGDGTISNKTLPFQITGLNGIKAIAAGPLHSFALTTDGTAWAWGFNFTGQLGDGTTTMRLVPVQVQGLKSTQIISGGVFHSLAKINLKNIYKNTDYSFTPTASDVDDGDVLTFSILNKPEWAAFDSTTGTLSGTPGADDIGSFDGIVISVADTAGATASLPVFSIIVNDVNRIPVISGIPETQTFEEQLYTFTPSASDADQDDTLTFSIVNKPSWATFNTSTGTLSGTPSSSDAGTTTGIVITVTDGAGAGASLPPFNISVNDTSAPQPTGDLVLSGVLTSGWHYINGFISTSGSTIINDGVDLDLIAQTKVKFYSGFKVMAGGKLKAAASPDTDGDLIHDIIEIRSGCMDYQNPDTDGEGLLDSQEDINRNGIFEEELNETNACSTDTDNDKMDDKWERDYHLDPLLDDAQQDPDNDKLTNYMEYYFKSSDPKGGSTSLPPKGTYYEYDELGRVKKIIRVK